MAQAAALRTASERGLDVTVSSGGCATVDGMPASQNSVAVCAANGLDISQHTSHQITRDDLLPDRIFVCMTSSHEAWLSALGAQEKNIYRFDRQIPDPYGGDMDVYMHCFEEINEAVGRLLFRVAPNPADVTVRDADAGDISEIARLERECFSQPWSEKSLSEELELADSVLLAAIRGGELAGYIGMQHTGITGYITNVAVFEKHRRHGVASTLLRALMERARALGESEITLEVRSKNEGAIKLYETAGFENIGKRPGFYTEPADDAVIMTARLD